MLNIFSSLRKKWSETLFYNSKDLAYFLMYFLSKLLFKFKLHLYKLYFFQEKNINLKYFIYKIYNFFQKILLNEMNTQEKIDNNLILLTHFFLNKWFYYNQANKFIDKSLDVYYNFSQPFLNLNTSHKEFYIQNLTNLKQNFSIKKNIETFFKQNKSEPFKNHIKETRESTKRKVQDFVSKYSKLRKAKEVLFKKTIFTEYDMKIFRKRHYLTKDEERSHLN